MNDISSKNEYGLSCDAVRELIEARKTRDLTPSERNAVFEHCLVCKECREQNARALDGLLGG